MPCYPTLGTIEKAMAKSCIRRRRDAVSAAADSA